MIEFGPGVCGDLEAALSREWLETNGLGGFASSTIVGANTRRYHALLTAALRPPVERVVLLSKLEETIVIGGRRVELSANEYPGVFHPEGYRHLKQFRLDPFPIFTYEVEGIEIHKSVFMIHGQNSTVVQYEAAIPPGMQQDLWLELRPLVAFRDYHSTTRENSALRPHLRVQPGLVIFAPYEGLPSLYLAHDADEVDTTGFWFHNFEYRAERERGLDHNEDLYSPFSLNTNLRIRPQFSLIASTEPCGVDRAGRYRQAEIERRRALLAASPSEDPLVQSLVLAADQYIVSRGSEKTIIAGYPWFSDWGRDTMIALPGLTLATGRTEEARSILLAFARHVDRGMLPNRFPDAGEEPEYNTVDATLWFFEAIREWHAHTGDGEFVRDHLYDLLGEIISWHCRGTRHGIRVDEDGLLHAGEPGVQLTWMDAKIGDWVVTPRHGKPVEVQALWYNSLRIMEHLAAECGDLAGERQYADLAEQTRASFNRLFWNPFAGCLYDVVGDGQPDASIRPNQILAVSLPYGMLEPRRARQVVEVVTRTLLTPYGLRTLAPDDSRYIPRYEGDARSRDAAYHQGTVWPWLMGPFLTAFLKVNDFSPAALRQAERWLSPFVEHLQRAGLGQVSEIFDAEPPHAPRGCFAQAWSVAELFRVALLTPQAAAAKEVLRVEIPA